MGESGLDAFVNTSGPAPDVRVAVESLRPSLIREVANAGFGLDGVLPFWFGESDRVTPAFIRDAASAALARGETFYTHNLGAAPLREALADYVSSRHGPTRAAQIAVTSAGVSALMLAAQLLVGASDRVVAITPLWPNLVEIPKILGARVECVPLAFGEAGWRLDLERLLAALTPDTRMLFVNSPNNPTGWTLSTAEQAAILAHCRRRGIWIVADEVYERLGFGEGGAPSFLDLASRDERVIVVNSFSKAWAMTGWRLGWLVVPPALVGSFEKLAQNLFICASALAQHAALACFEPDTLAIYEARRLEFMRRRDYIVPALASLGFEVPVRPDGAFYVYARCGGVAHPAAGDSAKLVDAMLEDAGVVLVPGMDFGVHAPRDYIRLSYATAYERLEEAVARLRKLFGG